MKTMLAALVALGTFCFAASSPSVAPLTAKFRSDTDAIEVDHSTAIARAGRVYEDALDAAEKSAIAKGDVTPLAAITAERNALKAGKLRPTASGALPKSLLPAQKTYLAGVAKADAETTPRKQRALADYLRALATLQSRSAGNANLVGEITAEKEAAIRGIPADMLAITKQLTGTTWAWAPKETAVFMDHGKGRWSVGGGKEFTWKVADPAVRKIEGINGKGNPFTVVFDESMESGKLVEERGSAREIHLLPAGRK